MWSAGCRPARTRSMTWTCCATTVWGGSSVGSGHPRPWERSCARSPMGMCSNSTRSTPAHRRTQSRPAGTSAIGAVHRERRLGRARGHRVQPGPRHRRRGIDAPVPLGQCAQEDHQHHCPHRDHGPQARPAHARRLAMGHLMGVAVVDRNRPTRNDRRLTTQPNKGATQGPKRESR